MSLFCVQNRSTGRWHCTGLQPQCIEPRKTKIYRHIHILVKAMFESYNFQAVEPFPVPASCTMLLSSDSVLADISVRKTRKLFILLQKNDM